MKENQLVIVSGKKVLCDSRLVAEKFKKKHAYIVDAIKKLILDFDKIKGRPNRPLIQEKKGECGGG